MRFGFAMVVLSVFFADVGSDLPFQVTWRSTGVSSSRRPKDPFWRNLCGEIECQHSHDLN